MWKLPDIFIWKFLFFSGKIINIFEQACFRNACHYSTMCIHSPKYSRLSLSRLRLSRKTPYLEVKMRLLLAHLSFAQDELLWSLFVRRASVRQHFQTTSPLKLLSQFCSNFIWSHLRVGERKIAKMVAVRWSRWPPCPYMVKIFKNLLLQNRGTLGLNLCKNHRGREVYQSC